MSSIILAALGMVLSLALCVFLVQLAQSRDGYEDEAGFHLGKRSNSKRKSRILPRTRFSGIFVRKAEPAKGASPQPNVATPRRL